MYIGNIDSDDYESAEFNLHVKGTRDKSVQLPLRIEYRDSNNNEFKKDTILNLRLYSGSEAKKYGLVPASNPLKSILFLAIVLWGIWFYYKKKKNKDLLKISIEKLKILKQKLKRKK